MIHSVEEMKNYTERTTFHYTRHVFAKCMSAVQVQTPLVYYFFFKNVLLSAFEHLFLTRTREKRMGKRESTKGGEMGHLYNAEAEGTN